MVGDQPQSRHETQSEDIPQSFSWTLKRGREEQPCPVGGVLGGMTDQQ